MADQKQHAKITQQVRDLYRALNDCVSHSGSLQLLADALRDARLDEALTHWNPLIPHRGNTTDQCPACQRIAALERGEA